MKVQIWKEQADLFEINVLAQTVEVSTATISDIVADVELPVVLIGRALNTDRLVDIRSIINAVFRSSRTILIVPPYGDLEITRYIDAPLGIRLQRRSPDSLVNLVNETLRNELGKTLTIRSDHAIETSLGAGILATDGSGKPVAVRYQPSNTSGIALICSIQLLSYTALSSEEDRQALLYSLLSWPTEKNQSVTETIVSADAQVDSGHLATILIALYASRSLDPKYLRDITETFLQLSLDLPEVKRVLAHLMEEGVIAKGSAENLHLQDDVLKSVLDSLGLHAYARELQEIIQEYKEVRA